MLLLSEYIYKNNLSSISCEEAKQIYDNYVSVRNFPKINLIELFDKIINRSGLIYKNYNENILFFKHRTFIEFFYAKYLNKSKEIDVNSNIFNPFEHNVFIFYIGLMQDCPQILKKMLEVKPTNNFQRFYRPFALSDYFLAGYSTPYNIVKDNMFEIFIESAKFYNEVITEKIILPFSCLSEANILWIFQLLFRDKFSFSFFEEALIDTCYRIEDCNEIMTEEKVIALFLVCCVKFELKINNPFDFLIEFHEDEIPFAAKFIVMQETENLKEKSEFLKKLDKRVAKELRKSGILINNILKKPIIAESKIKQLLENKITI